MGTLKIVQEPAEVLRKKSKEVTNIKNEGVKKLISKMIAAMQEANGVGLAAPQINKGIRIMIVSTKDGPLACINPVILRKSIMKEWMEEGCLSVSGTFGRIKRHRSITVSFLNEQGINITVKARGLLAQIFQHEVDHLNGILFIDRAKNLKKIRTG